MKRLLPFLLAAFALTACSTGKKALKQGDFDQAVAQAIHRLEKSPDNRKALETLTKAYPRFLAYSLDRVAIINLNADPLRWEESMDIYAGLNRAYAAIQLNPKAQRLIRNPQGFHVEYEHARTQAAEAHLALGDADLALGRSGSRGAAREAYWHFSRALELRDYLPHARSKMAEARELGTLRVALEPVPTYPRAYAPLIQNFEQDVARYFRKKDLGPFLIVQPWYAFQQQGQEVDHFVHMEFVDFNIGQATIHETIITRESDSVAVDEVRVLKDGEWVTKEVMGIVTADIHRFEKIITAHGILELSIIDAESQALIAQTVFDDDHSWEDSWGYFTGDERALSGDDDWCIDNNGPDIEPSPREMFEGFSDPIRRQASRFIKNFFEGIEREEMARN